MNKADLFPRSCYVCTVVSIISICTTMYDCGFTSRTCSRARRIEKRRRKKNYRACDSLGHTPPTHVVQKASGWLLFAHVKNYVKEEGRIVTSEDQFSRKEDYEPDRLVAMQGVICPSPATFLFIHIPYIPVSWCGMRSERARFCLRGRDMGV